MYYVFFLQLLLRFSSLSLVLINLIMICLVVVIFLHFIFSDILFFFLEIFPIISSNIVFFFNAQKIVKLFFLLSFFFLLFFFLFFSGTFRSCGNNLIFLKAYLWALLMGPEKLLVQSWFFSTTEAIPFYNSLLMTHVLWSFYILTAENINW